MKTKRYEITFKEIDTDYLSECGSKGIEPDKDLLYKVNKTICLNKNLDGFATESVLTLDEYSDLCKRLKEELIVTGVFGGKQNMTNKEWRDIVNQALKVGIFQNNIPFHIRPNDLFSEGSKGELKLYSQGYYPLCRKYYGITWWLEQ